MNLLLGTVGREEAREESLEDDPDVVGGSGCERHERESV